MHIFGSHLFASIFYDVLKLLGIRCLCLRQNGIYGKKCNKWKRADHKMFVCGTYYPSMFAFCAHHFIANNIILLRG